jgi:aspartate aminotransferase
MSKPGRKTNNLKMTVVEMRRTYLSKATEALQPSVTEEVDNEVKRMRQNGINDIVSLGVGEPCFDTPDHIKQATIGALMRGETSYQPTKGAYTLREAISAKLDTENGVKAGPEDIIVTAGGKFAIYLAFQATLEKGDKVLLLDPAWVSYESAAQMAGADVIRVAAVPQNGFKPDLENIKRAMDSGVKIIVVNSPCNPTGAVFPIDTIRALAELARDSQALLLSDEVYEYQLYEGQQYSAASEFDNVITVNSFSKSYAMTGWRLGYATGPKEVLAGMLKIYQHSTTCVTAFAQYGALEALNSEASLRAVETMKSGYRARRHLMTDLIEKSEFLTLGCVPEGAFYCFAAYNVNLLSFELAKRLLREAHVATVPGVAFGECGEGHLRLSYAAPEEDIREAFRRMENHFRKIN